jgi:25S rRNA (uracil2634-N3)-methyltransferase
VVFVFPHTGCGIKDRARNIADQKRLLMGFFLSAAQMLAKQGEIHLTVKRGMRSVGSAGVAFVT